MNTYYSYLLPSFSFLSSSLVTVPFPLWVELSKLITVAKSVAEDHRTCKNHVGIDLEAQSPLVMVNFCSAGRYYTCYQVRKITINLIQF